MATLILNMDQMPKMSFLMLLLCLFLSLDNHNTPTPTNNTRSSSPSHSPSVTLDSFPKRPISLSVKNEDRVFDLDDDSSQSLEYDFYRNSCPQAERIVLATIRRLHRSTPNLVPALIRLLFHDCFIQGCDASVLLDDDDYIDSEKESPPNGSLKGFDVIETIKSKLEEACPGVVSCADILVLAARDCVVLAGGPFYPLYTGRRDSSNSFSDIATYELPSPYGDLSQTLASFASRGFDEREMVTLLGAHSIGVIHCKFFQNRLYNFTGTNEPDPSLDIEFLNLLRSRCSYTSASSSSASECTSHNSTSSEAVKSLPNKGSPSSEAVKSTPLKGSPSSSVEEPGVAMDFEQARSDFGTSYYRSLLQGRGILYADQQLMAGEGTENWVKAYAFEPTLFHRDFALAMMKLSDLRVLTLPMGQIRLSCSKVA